VAEEINLNKITLKLVHSFIMASFHATDGHMNMKIKGSAKKLIVLKIPVSLPSLPPLYLSCHVIVVVVLVVVVVVVVLVVWLGGCGGVMVITIIIIIIAMTLTI
jgi:hypothetical protein